MQKIIIFIFWLILMACLIAYSLHYQAQVKKITNSTEYQTKVLNCIDLHRITNEDIKQCMQN